CGRCSPTRPSASRWRAPPPRRPERATRGTRSASGRCSSTASSSGRPDDRRQPIIPAVALEIVFWLPIGLIVYAPVGYPLLLWGLVSLFGERGDPSAWTGDLPSVSVLVAAYDEEDVIERKVQNARALDYPADRLQLVVASDGSADRTGELARSAGADVVLELSRGGKVASLNAAAAKAEGAILAFSDANSFWQPGALKRLVSRFGDERVGYACGLVRYVGGEGNEEGLYWRYEMWVRRMESRLAGITGGNGGICAVRREAFVELHPSRGQDISFPFELTKRGWRAVYEPSAIADE